VLVVLLAAGTGACASRTGGANEFPELREYDGLEIDVVAFRDTEPFSADSLIKLIATQASRCSLLGIPVCVPFTNFGQEEHYLDPGTVTRDVQRLEMFYRSAGYFGTQVRPEAAPNREDVSVTFVVERGDAIILDSLTLMGTEGVVDPDSLAATLPLQAGEIFNLTEFATSADTVLRAMQVRGHAYATLLRNFTVDTLRDRAAVALEAIPGPRVTVDSIVVRGAETMGRTTALRQLTFARGDLLLLTDLTESQRNLYALDLVQFASVTVAPDSLQAFPDDSSRATVLVALAEASEHEVDAAVGFGTIECFRTEARWADRSFGGGARLLRLRGELSKIGVGQGLGGSVCSAYERDTLAATLDYHASAELVQPYFISPRNNLTFNVFADRQSEPTIFRRTAQGARLALGRRLAPRTTLSAGFDVEHGQTLANASIYCVAFQVCLPEDIERLSVARFRNTISASILRDRTDVVIDPTRGTTARVALAWAPPWLLSDVTFIRLILDGSYYRELRPGVVGAASLQLGTFFQSATIDTRDFLPPEERFYAGGATSVRGYDRNALGPGIWLAEPVRDTAGVLRRDDGVPVPDSAKAEFVPTGGTALIVGNVEVRFPSPFMRDILRLAAFVDAGSVGSGNLWDRQEVQLRLTPGVGIRMHTPVGPVRIDIAYNPHQLTEGALFVRDETALYRVRDHFRPERASFLSRLRVHLGVGQAF
jgi:outer membrane protein assembly factor BamA